MPILSWYECQKCHLRLDSSAFGNNLYVINDDGKRVPCERLGFFQAVARITGFTFWSVPKDRIGYYDYCICTDCLESCKVDLKHDSRICPKCGGDKVFADHELKGKPCPRCKDDTVAEISTGMHFSNM